SSPFLHHGITLKISTLDTPSKSHQQHKDSSIISPLTVDGTPKRRKRKIDYSPAPSNRSVKRRGLETSRNTEVIDITDDESDDTWSTELSDTGYQSTSGYESSAYRTYPYPSSDIESLRSFYHSIDTEPLTRASTPATSQYTLTTRTTPHPGKGLAIDFETIWNGPNGGPIKFLSKPLGFNDRVFSRWSYGETGPSNAAVEGQTEGDIHFSPSNGRGTSEAFLYWVCVSTVRGLRWVTYSCGQPHPTYPGFVLKPAVPRSSTPPKWIKEASFRASRS
ncbi:hypothetical protein FRC11_007797, partial [Ceratobasidium sp. 423]